MFAYILFNMAAAAILYYVFRVRRFTIKSLRKPKGDEDTGHRKSREKEPQTMKGFYLSFYFNLILSILRNMVR